MNFDACNTRVTKARRGIHRERLSHQQAVSILGDCRFHRLRHVEQPTCIFGQTAVVIGGRRPTGAARTGRLTLYCGFQFERPDNGRTMHAEFPGADQLAAHPGQSARRTGCPNATVPRC